MCSRGASKPVLQMVFSGNHVRHRGMLLAARIFASDSRAGRLVGTLRLAAVHFLLYRSGRKRPLAQNRPLHHRLPGPMFCDPRLVWKDLLQGENTGIARPYQTFIVTGSVYVA